jgi:hypothetical protein
MSDLDPREESGSVLTGHGIRHILPITPCEDGIVSSILFCQSTFIA